MSEISKDVPTDFEGTAPGIGKPTYSGFPSECPICHMGIDVRIINAYADGGSAQVLFQCPRNGCHSYFIGYYTSYIDAFGFSGHVLPIRHVERIFPDVIKNVSPNFVIIYNESKEAEENNLLQICGAGYRKALEFLVKDYSISKVTEDDKKEKIKDKLLSNVINENIDNIKIKDMAKRAAWLGNDETHYLRKWDEQDLKDLKKLIDLTLHLIEDEKSFDDYLVEMPKGK
jgi:hypothetical protein